MLTIDSLHTGYGRRHVIGHGLTASLPEGSLTALIGRNGVGKSTLLRTLAGLQPPAGSGTVSWQGTDLLRLPPRRLARLLSVVLTFRPDADTLTAAEVVSMGRIPHSRLFLPASPAADARIVHEAMALTATLPLASRPVRTLSDGERQRVFIAKALAQSTPLILLDEPTAFLDFPAKAATLRLLRRLAHGEGKTILLSTHDVELALRFADRLWLLAPDGIRQGTPRALADEGAIASFFAADGIGFSAAAMRFAFGSPEAPEKEKEEEKRKNSDPENETLTDE